MTTLIGKNRLDTSPLLVEWVIELLFLMYQLLL